VDKPNKEQKRKRENDEFFPEVTMKFWRQSSQKCFEFYNV